MDTVDTATMLLTVNTVTSVMNVQYARQATTNFQVTLLVVVWPTLRSVQLKINAFLVGKTSPALYATPTMYVKIVNTIISVGHPPQQDVVLSTTLGVLLLALVVSYALLCSTATSVTSTILVLHVLPAFLFFQLGQ